MRDARRRHRERTSYFRAGSAWISSPSKEFAALTATVVGHVTSACAGRWRPDPCSARPSEGQFAPDSAALSRCSRGWRGRLDRHSASSTTSTGRGKITPKPEPALGGASACLRAPASRCRPASAARASAACPAARQGATWSPFPASRGPGCRRGIRHHDFRRLRRLDSSLPSSALRWRPMASSNSSSFIAATTSAVPPR